LGKRWGQLILVRSSQTQISVFVSFDWSLSPHFLLARKWSVLWPDKKEIAMSVVSETQLCTQCCEKMSRQCICFSHIVVQHTFVILQKMIDLQAKHSVFGANMCFQFDFECQNNFANTFNIVREKFIEGSIVLFSFDHPKKPQAQKIFTQTNHLKK